MTGLQFMEQYRSLQNEKSKFIQTKENAFRAFSYCPTESLDICLSLDWKYLYNWDNYYPNSQVFELQDFDYIQSCFYAVINGHMTRDELKNALSPSIISIERHLRELNYDEQYMENILEEKLKSYLESLDTINIIRNVLYLSIPYLKDFLIKFLIFDETC